MATNIIKLLKKVSAYLPEDKIFGVARDSIKTESDFIRVVGSFCREASEEEIEQHAGLMKLLMERDWQYYARIEELIWSIRYNAEDYHAYKVQLQLTERY